MPRQGSRREQKQTRAQNRPAFKMFNEVIKRIRRDPQDQISSRQLRRNGLPDSTADLSRALLEPVSLYIDGESLSRALTSQPSRIDDEPKRGLPKTPKPCEQG